MAGKPHFEEPVVVDVLRTTETRRAMTQVAIIEWNINGKKYRTLVKRDTFAGQEGAPRFSKTKGLNGDDWALLTSSLEMINRVAAGLGKGATAPDPVGDAAALANLQANPVRESAPADPAAETHEF